MLPASSQELNQAAGANYQLLQKTFQESSSVSGEREEEDSVHIEISGMSSLQGPEGTTQMQGIATQPPQGY